MTQQERGLTWSKKWHILKTDYPDSRRYAMGLCGTYVYKDTDPSYPAHLQAIKDGKRKSTGLCKVCAKSAKIAEETITSIEYRTTWEVYTDNGWKSSERIHQSHTMAEFHRMGLLMPDMKMHVRNVGPIQKRTVTTTKAGWEDA